MRSEPIDADVLAEDYYENLHVAHRSLRSAFANREAQGLTQEALARRLDIDKALISRRLSGRENFTLKTLSHMASALDCRLSVEFTPHESIAGKNHFSPSWRGDRTFREQALSVAKESPSVLKQSETYGDSDVRRERPSLSDVFWDDMARKKAAVQS